MPESKEAAIERQGPAERFRRWRLGEVERAEQVPSDVGPAKLPLADDIFQVGRQPIAAENADERLAQDRLQYVGTTRRQCGRARTSGRRVPEPPFLAVRSVSRRIGVDHGLVRQRRFEFCIGRRDRDAGFLPAVLGAARIPSPCHMR